MAWLSSCLVCLVVFLGSVSSAVAGPLGNAAKAGDIAEIARLLNEGADVNESGLASPLFYAIQSNHTDAARLLVEHGADVSKAHQTTSQSRVRAANTPGGCKCDGRLSLRA